MNKPPHNAPARFAWMLESDPTRGSALHEPYYGDVTELNEDGVILRTVGQETLGRLASDLMDLLGTSVAVYERNGDYAYGIFASGWCRLMDGASRRLCGTEDNREALESGKWLCHENCWNDSARAAMESGEPTDIACVGGIHLYGVPILACGEVIGAVNVGYGDPPEDPEVLEELASAYDLDPAELHEAAAAYDPRPPFLVELAKRRLRSTAWIIGEIVERKRAEGALQAAESHYEALFLNMNDGVAVYEAVGDGEDFLFKDLNPAGERLGGTPKETVAGRSVREVYPGVEELGLFRVFQEVWRTGESRQHPMAAYEDDRITLWVENDVLKLPSGEIVAIYRDISEQKRAERALGRSEAMMGQTEAVAHVGSWDWALRSDTITWSDELYRIFGLSLDDGPPPFEEHSKLFPPDDMKRLREAVEAAMTEGTPYEMELTALRSDGERRRCHVRGFAETGPAGKIDHLFGSFQDITEFREAEETLRSTADLLEATGRMALVGGWELDARTREVTWSTQTYRLHEVPLGEMPSLEEAIDFFDPEDQPRLAAAVERALAEGEPYDLQLRFVTAKGRRLWTRTVCRPVVENGETVRLIGTFQDITAQKTYEEQIEETRRETEWLLHSMSNAFVVFDSVFDQAGKFVSYRFVYINEAYERITGVKNDEVKGKTVHEVWPETEPEWIRRYGEVAVTGIAQSFELYHAPTAKHYSCNVYRPWDTMNRFCVVFEDTTERKRAEDAARRAHALLDTIIDQSPFAMWIADPSGTVVRTNASLRRALNLTDEQIIGHYCVFDDRNIEQQGLMPRVRAVFEERRPERFSLAWRAQDAGDVDFESAPDLHLDVSLFPILADDGSLSRAVCQWVDVTDRVRAELGLRELTASLERRVAERTADLEASNKELEAFAYSVSHDLRAPPRAITGFAGIIARRYRESLDEEGRHYFENIVEAGEQMGRLIEDLLDYSRLGRQAEPTARIDLDAALAEALQGWQPTIEKEGIRVELPAESPRVRGRAALVRQVCVNLLGNALTYRKPEGVHRVEVRCLAEGSRVVLEVEDNGIGIPNQHLEKIFNLFQRLHPQDRYPGTGVGLALVRKAVALMDGTIEVESEPGRGTVFRVRLPAADPGREE